MPRVKTVSYPFLRLTASYYLQHKLYQRGPNWVVANYVHKGSPRLASTETAQPGTSSTETAQPLDNHVVATWKNLKTAYTKETVPSFTEGQLVSYFVCRTVADGLPAGDFKSINKSAKYLFDCGHVQDIHIGSSTTKTLIKASCLPEMKKDRVYKILMSLDTTTWDILNADCG